MAEGEFALVKEHLEVASSKPVSAWSLLGNETVLYFMLADIAVQERDEAALRQYAPLAEETANRDGHILYQASAHRAWGVMYRLQGEYADAETRLNQALELFQYSNGKLASSGNCTLEQNITLTSNVLPLTFHLVAAKMRPKIEVNQTDGRKQWLV